MNLQNRKNPDSVEEISIIKVIICICQKIALSFFQHLFPVLIILHTFVFLSSMSRYINILIAFLTGSILLSSCNEFFEPELKNKKVFLTSPGENSQSNRYNQTFRWEQVDEAGNYRLQVATPSFDSIADILLDTLVSDTKFAFTLEPGIYEWRVRAENSASSSQYSSRKFTIIESSLASQQVQIVSPGTGTVSNNRNITFKWLSLFGASDYKLQVDSGNFSNEETMLVNTTTTETEYTQVLSRDNIYRWRVKAVNDTSESKWSAVQSFTFDNTPPAKVTLLLPANNTTVSRPVGLQWEAVSGAAKYLVQVYKSDSSTPYSSSFPVTVTSASYSFTAGESGETLYWKVCAVDATGNAGPYSDLRSFIVQF